MVSVKKDRTTGIKKEAVDYYASQGFSINQTARLLKLNCDACLRIYLQTRPDLQIVFRANGLRRKLKRDIM
jgi:hypothetical protein